MPSKPSSIRSIPHPNQQPAGLVAWLGLLTFTTTKAVKPHAGRQIHVVLDNLFTHHTAGHGLAGQEPTRDLPFHPIGSSWVNQVENWFGIITRQAIRRGTFSSVQVLIGQIRAYIASWNTDREPFAWTATADEILAKVQLVHTNIKKLVDNKAK
jgi:hypothetical protein